MLALSGSLEVSEVAGRVSTWAAWLDSSALGAESGRELEGVAMHKAGG